MILLLLPALASWIAIYAVRARLLRFGILVVSPIPVWWVGHLYERFASDPIPPRLVFAYAALVMIVGVLVALAPPRRREHECHKCGYDLTGMEGIEVCPECGQMTQAAQARHDAEVRAARREAIREHHAAIRTARETKAVAGRAVEQARSEPGLAEGVGERRPVYKIAGRG